MIWVNYTTLNGVLPASVIGSFLRCLPATKADAIACLRDSKQATASVLGLGLLAQATEQLCVFDFSFHQLNFSPMQKPGCSLGIEFNITHSANIVACAVSLDSPLGIDSESMETRNAGLLRHVFNEKELTLIQNNNRLYLDLWVKKEAVSKAAGDGLGAMKAIVLNQDHARYNEQQWYLHRLMLDRNDVSYLACQHPQPDIKCQKQAFDDCVAYCTDAQFQNRRYG
ncbi:4'-phosphopantetheinyl transferase family protein [Kaarinaea lacus]